MKGHLLTTPREAFLCGRAAMYAEAIENAGAPLDIYVGSIDRTKIRMTRPGGSNRNQRAWYSDHKRFHCLVYQTITTSTSLILSLYCPEESRRHDMTLLHNIGISEALSSCLLINRKRICMYGDAAYILRVWMQTVFHSVGAIEAEAGYNKDMSAVPVTD